MAQRARGISKTVHSAGQQAFRDMIIAARKGAGLTQEEVAKRLGKPQSFVAKYEGGERRVDVIEFLEIARALGVDPARIIKSLSRKTG
jgi:transcriptional regulator with XRE-family HTH domain